MTATVGLARLPCQGFRAVSGGRGPWRAPRRDSAEGLPPRRTRASCRGRPDSARRREGHDHVDFLRFEIARGLSRCLQVSPGIAHMKDEVLAFFEPQLLEAVAQSLQGLFVGTSPLVNDAHAIHTVLLRRGSERRSKEATREQTYERPPFHYSIT